MTEKISESNIESICEQLSHRDKRLAVIYKNHGAPPLWAREPTFATLIHIILEQQVSLASALAAFNKLIEVIGDITPENVLSLSDTEMKAAYFSRQKAAYARHLANAVRAGGLDLAALDAFPDDEVRARLMQIKGIGRWTSDIFLLMCLMRPDVMPKGDIALYKAWQTVDGLAKRPMPEEFDELSVRWKPYRSVAARLLWHFYLSERKAD